ncbi:radical SAM protein [Methanopyrus sp.]
MSEPRPNDHPCYVGEHGKFVKVHLPVGGSCNIHCRFCESGLEHDGMRADYPGRTVRTVTGDDAKTILERVKEHCGRVDVVGIAGPGDPLANWEAVKEIFDVAVEVVPEAKRCLSTNGVWLPDLIDEVTEIVNSITITVNALDPETAAEIYDRALTPEGEVLTGKEAAEWIVDRQEEAIDALKRERYVLKKVNFVLIPGVNEEEVERVAKRAADARFHVMNVIPLIPGGDMKDHRPPTCRELSKARDRADKYITVMRKCMQCRADVIHCHGKPRLIWELLEEA